MSHVDDGTLHAYLDGELAPAEAQGVDAHLAQCPACRSRVDEERALIARADELLGLAAPPDRAVPPFRAGDLKPPVRLWWQLRLPLAWAATVTLALGIGMYLGGGVLPRRAPPPATEARDSAARDLTAPRLAARAPQAKQQAARGGAAATPVAPPLPVERDALRESAAVAANALGRARREPVAPSFAARKAAAEPSPPPPQSPPATVPVSLDSARQLLGQDPLALPDVPIRALRHERVPGEVVIVVEQALDSTTVIELRERRPLPLALSEVVVTGAYEGRQGPERARHDSVAAGMMRAPTLRVEISGPLPADSLKQLWQRLKPVKP